MRRLVRGSIIVPKARAAMLCSADWNVLAVSVVVSQFPNHVFQSRASFTVDMPYRSHSLCSIHSPGVTPSQHPAAARKQQTRTADSLANINSARCWSLLKNGGPRSRGGAYRLCSHLLRVPPPRVHCRTGIARTAARNVFRITFTCLVRMFAWGCAAFVFFVRCPPRSSAPLGPCQDHRYQMQTNQKTLPTFLGEAGGPSCNH